MEWECKTAALCRDRVDAERWEVGQGVQCMAWAKAVGWNPSLVCTSGGTRQKQSPHGLGFREWGSGWELLRDCLLICSGQITADGG